MRREQRKLVMLLGIDTVREKTLFQARWLHGQGFDVHVLTAHRDPGSVIADPSATIEAIQPSPLARVRQLLRRLRMSRGRLHHVELYVGGRFAVVYALLCRLARVRVIAVERGDLLQCQRRNYPLMARLSIYASYRLAHLVWLREPYMVRAFERWRVRRTFFLPNAVPLPDSADSPDERTVDFLWVNRLVPERHPDWFAAAVELIAARGPVTCELLGFSRGDPSPSVAAMERAVHAALDPLPGCRCELFRDPSDAYRRARFFVLPADVVFGNFALLEAMAHGVVPVVSDVEGSSLLVEPDRNGFLLPHDRDALARGLEHALALPEPEWRRLSAAARATIAERFSIDAWGRQLLLHYREVVA